MSPTTPPRPVDIAAVFPQLREFAATATRLHPRPGVPGPGDSSVGGPLLWPAGEPWPVCEEGDLHYSDTLLTPATVRRSREIFAAAQARPGRYELTEHEQAQLPDLDFSEPRELLDQPVPLIPVAQLYRRDIPDFAGPGDADLLQVLWCPLDHPEEGYNPLVRLVWRRSADVTAALAAPPEPPVVNENYLPDPCVVHPEQIVEYPYRTLLPDPLRERLGQWDGIDEDDGDAAEVPGRSYSVDLSFAPGWKVGGYSNWSLTDPYPVGCGECGTPMTLLFTAASGEWDGGGGTWRPRDEPDLPSRNQTGVLIGRSYSLYVFRCPASFDHPPRTAMQ